HEGLLGVAGAQGWQAPYRPNIDEVAEQVSGYYGGRAGIIVFSGMGDDGGRGSALISAGGGQVWVQSPASCAAVAMPEAVLRRVTPSQQGAVEDLAETFNQYLNDGPG